MYTYIILLAISLASARATICQDLANLEAQLSQLNEYPINEKTLESIKNLWNNSSASVKEYGDSNSEILERFRNALSDPAQSKKLVLDIKGFEDLIANINTISAIMKASFTAQVGKEPQSSQDMTQYDYEWQQQLQIPLKEIINGFALWILNKQHSEKDTLLTQEERKKINQNLVDIKELSKKTIQYLESNMALLPVSSNKINEQMTVVATAIDKIPKIETDILTNLKLIIPYLKTTSATYDANALQSKLATAAQAGNTINDVISINKPNYDFQNIGISWQDNITWQLLLEDALSLWKTYIFLPLINYLDLYMKSNTPKTVTTQQIIDISNLKDAIENTVRSQSTTKFLDVFLGTPTSGFHLNKKIYDSYIKLINQKIASL